MLKVKKVLMVDDNRDFVHFIKNIAALWPIEFTSVNSLNEGRIALQHKSYDLIIVDGYLPDGLGIDFLRQLRQENKQYLLAFISLGYSDARSFRFLKNTLELDYVLNKPLTRGEIEAFMHALFTEENSMESHLSDQEALAKAQELYKYSICDKVECLENLLNEVQKTPSGLSLKGLQNELHKISGSAASFGYPDVGALCKSKEKQIQDIFDHSELFPPSIDWMDSLQEFLKKIKLAFQHFHFTEPKVGAKAPAGLTYILPNSCDLFVVDDDQELIDSLLCEAQNHGLRLEFEIDPFKARERLSDVTFNPKVLLIKERFASPIIDGWELLMRFKSCREGVFAHSSIGMILEIEQDNTDFDFNVTVGQQVDFFFYAHTKAQVILKRAQTFIGVKKQGAIRVLLIEDDSHLANLAELILAEVGVQTHILHEGSHLLEEIDLFQPHLLIIDLGLPDFDGMDLLRIVRSDVRYKHLPIIVMTSSSEDQVIEEAYLHGVDDFIIKPVTKRILQIRVLHFIRKHASFASVRDTDSLTTLSNRRVATEACLEMILKERQGALALIDLDGLKKINDRYGHHVGDQALRKFSQFLGKAFSHHAMLARWGGDEFVLLYKDSPLGLVEKQLNMFLNHVHKECFIMHEGQKIPLIFSAGIAEYPNDGSTLEALFQAADFCLYHAKEQGGSCVYSTMMEKKKEGESQFTALVRHHL